MGTACAAITFFGTAIALHAMPSAQANPSGADPEAEEKTVSDCEEPITLAAVGDVLLHDTFQNWAAQQSEGYYAAMKPVEDLMRGADVTVANLEGAAAKDLVGLNGQRVATPSSIYDGKAYSGYPLFNYHPSVVTDLKRLGVDVLQTANNHSLDRGRAGADRTLDAIEEAGLVSTGTRRASAWSKHYDWSARFTVRRGDSDYTFAFVACTYGTNGIADKRGQVLHCYDQRAELMSQIRTLSGDDSVSAVIVLPHWGKEYEPLPENLQAGLARDMANAGATAIIGSHPHVVQPERMVTTTDGRTVPVLYSLGNFVSRQIGLPRLTTIIYLLGFEPAENGKLAVTKSGWVPLRMNTDGVMSLDALDRISESEAAPYLAHLLETYPASKRLPADPGKFWNNAPDLACAAEQ
jgi:poly-gamma-glutamate synthesis protein (capsule biosynthesis protein)